MEDPLFTSGALDLAEDLHEHNHELFDLIRALLPSTTAKSGLLSLQDRLDWTFRKGRVDYLVGQLEYLKSTVSLLPQIVTPARKLRTYR